MKTIVPLFALLCLLTGCILQPTPGPTATPTPTLLPTPTIPIHRSTANFQVFILTPITVCVAANDYMSGSVCRGQACGGCDCTPDQYSPPPALRSILPEQLSQSPYNTYEFRECFDIQLTDTEIADITSDMTLIAQKTSEWTDGALNLNITTQVLPYVSTSFVAPDFAFGPFEVDDELLNPYVTTDSDFVYVVTGVYDRQQGINLAYWCGGSYGEMTVHGANYSYIQYNDICNSVTIGNQQVYEPLIHEWLHNLDWALFNVSGVRDIYQFKSVDWANWQPGDWPACGKGAMNTFAWFPSVDYCEWDPDWMDCNNQHSAGACLNAGEVDSYPSWYEHVLSAHYPRNVDLVVNTCTDGRQDWGETGIDSGGQCP